MRYLYLRHMALAVGVWLAATVPATAQAPDVPTIALPHERFVLPNGLTVILHEDHTLPFVSVNVWYHVGSGYEKAGRTGFAHLFEHIMFEGSKHVKEGDFDNLLEGVGGNNNGSTNIDRTNYYENLPSNALNLALFLESDRMGYLLDDLTQAKLDGQRDVVKNERRQRYENSPYGLSGDIIPRMMYPASHPYSWSTIGSMADLSAASLEDVKEFFRTYYVPNNAVLAIAGDIDPAKLKERIRYWFADVPAGKMVAPPNSPTPKLEREVREVLEDRVQLPRLYLLYHTPRAYAAGDAEANAIASILAGGESSRLYKKLVYEQQIAANVFAYNRPGAQGGLLYVVATARPGVTLEQLRAAIDAEIDKLRNEPPSARELQRVVNQNQAEFIGSLQSLTAKADILNSYFYYTGNPDWAQEDLSRYQALTPADIQAAAQTLLVPQRGVLSIVPQGKKELALPVQP